MDYNQVIEELKAQIAAKGKFSLTNAPDYLLGVATQNKDELQAMLNKLMEKQGVLSPEDETAVNKLLEDQKRAKKEKVKIIIRNTAVALGMVATGVVFWFTFKHKKK